VNARSLVLLAVGGLLACGSSLAPVSGQLGGVDASGAEASGDEGAPSGSDGGPPEATATDAEGGVADSPVTDSQGAPDQATTPGIDASAVTSVAPSNLRLWLTADKGVSCVQGRVQRWADQSTHSDDATLRNGQLGPQCGSPTGPHAVGGVALPYFSAPGSNNIDETLDVDLSFLAGASYTIFVVERRWADPSDNQFVLGTTLTNACQATAVTCTGPPDQALGIGYVYYNGKPQISLDQFYDTLVMDVAPVPATPPAPLTLTTAILDTTRGHELWINGVGSSSTNTSTLTSAAGGAVGRAMFNGLAPGADRRYRGDIAEVLVYDTALGSAPQAAVDAYLRSHWAF
jgi:hypothetical protein